MIIVEQITNGTVIDHINQGMGQKVLDLLGVNEKYPYRVALITNVPSKKMRKKDMVKIEGIFVNAKKANFIALVAPHATINIIKNEKAVKKFKAELPKRIYLGTCPNPNCITKDELGYEEFEKQGERYRCRYCERLFKGSELV